MTPLRSEIELPVKAPLRSLLRREVHCWQVTNTYVRTLWDGLVASLGSIAVQIISCSRRVRTLSRYPWLLETVVLPLSTST
jgi:hypothetical protein